MNSETFEFVNNLMRKGNEKGFFVYYEDKLSKCVYVNQRNHENNKRLYIVKTKEEFIRLINENEEYPYYDPDVDDYLIDVSSINSGASGERLSNLTEDFQTLLENQITSIISHPENDEAFQGRRSLGNFYDNVIQDENYVTRPNIHSNLISKTIVESPVEITSLANEEQKTYLQQESPGIKYVDVQSSFLRRDENTHPINGNLSKQYSLISTMDSMESQSEKVAKTSVRGIQDVSTNSLSNGHVKSNQVPKQNPSNSLKNDIESQNQLDSNLSRSSSQTNGKKSEIKQSNKDINEELKIQELRQSYSAKTFDDIEDKDNIVNKKSLSYNDNKILYLENERHKTDKSFQEEEEDLTDYKVRKNQSSTLNRISNDKNIQKSIQNTVDSRDSKSYIQTNQSVEDKENINSSQSLTNENVNENKNKDVQKNTSLDKFVSINNELLILELEPRQKSNLGLTDKETISTTNKDTSHKEKMKSAHFNDEKTLIFTDPNEDSKQDKGNNVIQPIEIHKDENISKDNDKDISELINDEIYIILNEEPKKTDLKKSLAEETNKIDIGETRKTSNKHISDNFPKSDKNLEKNSIAQRLSKNANLKVNNERDEVDSADKIQSNQVILTKDNRPNSLRSFNNELNDVSAGSTQADKGIQMKDKQLNSLKSVLEIKSKEKSSFRMSKNSKQTNGHEDAKHEFNSKDQNVDNKVLREEYFDLNYQLNQKSSGKDDSNSLSEFKVLESNKSEPKDLPLVKDEVFLKVSDLKSSNPKILSSPNNVPIRDTRNSDKEQQKDLDNIKKKESKNLRMNSIIDNSFKSEKPRSLNSQEFILIDSDLSEQSNLRDAKRNQDKSRIKSISKKNSNLQTIFINDVENLDRKDYEIEDHPKNSLKDSDKKGSDILDLKTTDKNQHKIRSYKDLDKDKDDKEKESRKFRLSDIGSEKTSISKDHNKLPNTKGGIHDMDDTGKIESRIFHLSQNDSKKLYLEPFNEESIKIQSLANYGKNFDKTLKQDKEKKSEYVYPLLQDDSRKDYDHRNVTNDFSININEINCNTTGCLCSKNDNKIFELDINCQVKDLHQDLGDHHPNTLLLHSNQIKDSNNLKKHVSISQTVSTIDATQERDEPSNKGIINKNVYIKYESGSDLKLVNKCCMQCKWQCSFGAEQCLANLRKLIE